jgi:MFS family permease
MTENQTVKNSSAFILIKIIIAQFFCTSLWFAGNAVSSQIVGGNSSSEVLIIAVQLGFIFGTLLFAVTKISDRFSPSLVFLYSSLIASVANLLIPFFGSIEVITFLRFITGVFLAGIYPVGMKIAADHHNKGLGIALGYLVGALVLGTALPFLIKGSIDLTQWQLVFYLTSGLAVFGGILIGFGVPDGPFRKKSPTIDFTAFFRIFKYPKFRAAAIGYFGHMWELYAFWSFIPVYLSVHQRFANTTFNISQFSFLIIAFGTLGCILMGYFAFRKSSRKAAANSLLISLLCCLLSPFIINLNFIFVLMFLLIWGFFVVADSPQFSTLVAQTSPAESKGTALTIVNSLGFAITIPSIYLVGQITGKWMFLPLAIGPIIGLFVFLKGTK